jgi:hypothetical protein
VHKLSGTFGNRFAATHVRHELQELYGLEDLPVYGEEHPVRRSRA